MNRSVLLVVHTGRAEAVTAATELAQRLLEDGVEVRVLDTEAAELPCEGAKPTDADSASNADLDLVVALGGDGTLLRAAEVARPHNTPLLGVNLGHVGFLAEVERSDLETTAEQIRSGGYEVEERMTVDVTVRRNGGHTVHEGWALNDATVEKAARERMLDLVVEVDGRPLSRWAGDGVVCATPTGSTAYAFSAGGPVVWPTVHALLVVPLSAHALFARPLVISPDSCVAIELLTGPSLLFCDGRRTVELAAGDRIEVRRGRAPVRLVRLRSAPFTDRLVEKFQLPVGGWRGPLRR